MTLYEYPFNESIRTMLRLEHLFDRLGQLIPRDAAVDHHFALATLFEILDVSARADLKSDLLKELDRYRQQYLSYRGNPSIAQGVLNDVLAQIDVAFNDLNQMQGKAGAVLNSHEWLMGVRSRIGIPGGTCEFDLPAYHAWQQFDPQRRRAQLVQWVSTMMPLAQALQVLPGVFRDAGTTQRVLAPAGQYQQSIPQGRTYQLIRVRLGDVEEMVPEISGHRLMVSVRLMRQDTEGRLRPAQTDVQFDLPLCA